MTHSNTLELEAVVGAGGGIHGKQQVPQAPGSRHTAQATRRDKPAEQQKDGELGGKRVWAYLETRRVHAGTDRLWICDNQLRRARSGSRSAKACMSYEESYDAMPAALLVGSLTTRRPGPASGAALIEIAASDMRHACHHRHHHHCHPLPSITIHYHQHCHLQLHHHRRCYHLSRLSPRRPVALSPTCRPAYRLSRRPPSHGPLISRAVPAQAPSPSLIINSSHVLSKPSRAQSSSNCPAAANSGITRTYLGADHTDKVVIQASCFASAVQYSTVPYSTVQYSAIPLPTHHTSTNTRSHTYSLAHSRARRTSSPPALALPNMTNNRP
jgi:hypothetical protein